MKAGFCVFIISGLHIYYIISSLVLQAKYEQFRAVGSSPGMERLIDQSGDAAEGIEFVVLIIPHEAREKICALTENFQLSGWAFVALSYFED